MTHKNLLFLSLLLLTACGSDDVAPQPEPVQPETERTAVNIQTRTDDTPQGVQVQAGLYMVNFSNGRHGQLLAANNYVNNQLLTWTGSAWQTSSPIYWNDMETPADFYAYAPYQTSVSDARQMPFSVQTDQTTAAALTESDLLWGTVQEQSPSQDDFSLILTHRLCQLNIVVTAEAGFSENELKASDVAVTFGGSITSGFIDLATGVVTASGTANDVKCMNNGDLSYKAILIPQVVPFSNLIQVNWKGNVYTLQNSFNMEAGLQYTITVRLKKSKSGFDIGIDGWDIIGEDFGGTIGGN